MTNAEPLDFLTDFPPVGEPRFWDYAPDRRLAWNEYGDPAGKPVLYYHGWPSSRLQARLAHRLALDRGLRLVAMDRPGMGKSTFEPGRKLSSWPGLMERFADSLGFGEFAQLAVSGGAPYALACAARIPDRLTRTAILAGAVPLDGLSDGRKGLHPVYRMMIPLRHAPAGIFTAFFRVAALGASFHPERPPMSWLLGSVAKEDRRVLCENPDVWAVIVKSFREGVLGGGGRGVMGDAEIFLQPIDLELPEISHPIRYWHGVDDRNIPLSMARELTGKIPGARLTVDESLGHFSLVLRLAPVAMDYLAERAIDGSD